MNKATSSRFLLTLILLASIAAKCSSCRNKATKQTIAFNVALTLAHEVAYIEDGKTKLNLAIQSADTQTQALKYKCLSWTVQQGQGKFVNAAGHAMEPSHILSHGDNILYYEPCAGSAGKHLLEVAVSDQEETIIKKQQLEITIKDHREVVFQAQIKMKKTVFFLHEQIMLTLEISASQAGASDASYKLQEISNTQGGKFAATAEGEEIVPGHGLHYGKNTLYYNAEAQEGVHDIKLVVSSHKGDTKTVTTSFKVIDAAFHAEASLAQVPNSSSEVLEAVIKVGAADDLEEDKWQLASWQVAGATGKLQGTSGKELSPRGISLQPGENRFALVVAETAPLTELPQLKLSIKQPDGLAKPVTLDLSERVFQDIQSKVSVLGEELKAAWQKAITGERSGQKKLDRVINQLAVFQGNLKVLQGATSLDKNQVEEVLVAVEELIQTGKTAFAVEARLERDVAFLNEQIKLMVTITATAQERDRKATYKLQTISTTKGGQFKATDQGEALPGGYELHQGVNTLYYDLGTQAGVHELTLVVSDQEGRTKAATTSLKALDVTFFSKADLVESSAGGNQSLVVIIDVGATELVPALDTWQLASWQVAGATGKLQGASGEELSPRGVRLQPGENRFPLALSKSVVLTAVPKLTLAVKQPDGAEKSLVLDLSKQLLQGWQTTIDELAIHLETALAKAATDDHYRQHQLDPAVEQLHVLRGNLDVIARSAAVDQRQAGAAIVQVEQLLQAASVSAIDRAIRKKFGRGVGEKDQYGRVPLIEAIDQGDEAGIDLVLKHPKVDLKDRYPIAHRQDMPPCPALHYAIIKRGDNTAMMQKLLEAGADINDRILMERKPLRFPNLKSDEQIVNKRKTSLYAELMGAALAAGVIKKTLWSSNRGLAHQNHQGETALHIAVQERSLESIKLLLDSGINVNASNGYGQTPLHLAENETIAQYLLTRSANANAVDLNDNTPLHYAAAGNNLGLVQLLIHGGANPHLRNRCCGVYASGDKVDSTGITPLEIARRKARSKQIVKLLSQHTTK